jgi:flagellar motor switch protein FliN/FliY
VAANDDLLTPDEIEALMKAARSAPASGTATAAPGNELDAPATSPPPSVGSPKSVLGAVDPVEARPQSRGRSVSGAEQLLQQAESQLAAALASDLGRAKGPPAELGPPRDFRFPDLADGAPESSPPAFPIAALQDVELDLRIELGRTELLIEEVLQLREGTVVPLDKLAGDPVDILVNGRLIARGEVLVLNDNFCVRVAEILTPDV